MQTCYRHGDRKAGVICQRCDRPICPSCMHQASVGFHCPECSKTGSQKIVRPLQLLTRPIVSQGLIAFMVLLFVVGIGPGLETRTGVIVDYALNGPDVAAGEWYRIVTGGFLHFNVIHVAFNMLALYQLGMLLEPAFGRLRFGLVYAVCLLTGSLGVLLFSPSSYTMGASGAVFGLMGFAFMAMRARGMDPWASGLGGTIVLNVIITFTLSAYISVGGHMGGLVGGAICGWVIHDAGPKHIKDERATLAVVAGIGVAAAVASILVA